MTRVSYRTPTREARAEREVKRSRFIGILLPARSAAEVDAALDSLRSEFPDATHHCWAYVLGDPASSPKMRADDAGEPSGTAGKPILNVLTQRGIGDAVVVVVRYFGGIKLGAGGLVRAYTSTASAVVDETPFEDAIEFVPVGVTASYADERQVRHVMEGTGIRDMKIAYGEEVVFAARVRADALGALRRALTESTSGRVTLEANV